MIGLFTDALGIVFAGVQVAKLTHHEEIMCRSQEVLARMLEGYDGSGGADVISGKAGAIPALLIGSWANPKSTVSRHFGKS
jgi:hypothetical protein